MKKTTLILALLFAGTTIINAQSTKGSVSANRRSSNTGSINTVSANSRTRQGGLELGGHFGMSFGDYTNINISPQIGYRFNRYVSLGGGMNYNYYNDSDRNYHLNYLGLNLYARAYPTRYLMAYIQPEMQRRWGKVSGADTEDKLFGCLLVGGGAVIPVGPRSGMTVTVYYDLVQNDYSPYGDNIGYSVGYTFNF